MSFMIIPKWVLSFISCHKLEPIDLRNEGLMKGKYNPNQILRKMIDLIGGNVPDVSEDECRGDGDYFLIDQERMMKIQLC